MRPPLQACPASRPREAPGSGPTGTPLLLQRRPRLPPSRPTRPARPTRDAVGRRHGSALMSTRSVPPPDPTPPKVNTRCCICSATSSVPPSSPEAALEARYMPDGVPALSRPPGQPHGRPSARTVPTQVADPRPGDAPASRKSFGVGGRCAARAVESNPCGQAHMPRYGWPRPAPAARRGDRVARACCGSRSEIV